MGRGRTRLTPPVVVLANGAFPVHPTPLRRLHRAGTVVCCDGAATTALERGIRPDWVVGDLDSLKDRRPFRNRTVRDLNPDSTDLAKALRFCAAAGARRVIVLGATGLREDHTMANLLLAAPFANALNIEFVTDFFRIVLVRGRKSIRVSAGQSLSLVSLSPAARFSLTGVRYPLSSTHLKRSDHGIGNTATRRSISVEARNGAALLFLGHRK